MTPMEFLSRLEQMVGAIPKLLEETGPEGLRAYVQGLQEGIQAFCEGQSDGTVDAIQSVTRELAALRGTIEKAMEDGRRPAPRIPGLGGG